jgi:arylsulfatase A-like enzyme
VPAGLELVEGSRIERPGGGLTVRGGWVAPRLALRRPLAAADAEAIRLVVSGLRVGWVRARWTGADGAPGGEVKLHRAEGTGALRDHFLIDLRGAGARPAELRLELEPTTAAGEIVTLSELCVGRVREVGPRLAELARVPWKVTLAGDTRDALLVPPAGEIARPEVLGGPARLDFAVGLVLGRADAVRVAVERRAPGAAAERLREWTLPAAELGGGWRELELELPAAARTGAELAVRVEPQGGSADFVAALGAPRVVPLGGRDPRPNIVLVSIDTLRADHLSLYGYERPTSPGIDAWARAHAAVFRRVVAPSSWTLPSHFSLFTGIDGFAHPANHSSISIDASAYRFLAAQLLEAGYRTRAYTGGAYVSPDYGLARGFESFRWWEHKDRREAELETHLELAGRWLEAAAAREGEGREPFFLFLHTYEVHTPNHPREPWFSRFHGGPDDRVVDLGTPDPPDPTAGFLGGGHFVLRRPTSPAAERLTPADAALPRDAYDSNIAYLDERLAPLLERLTRPPFAGNTLIAVVSDHGESLGEEGRAGHNFLTVDNLLVPMLVAMPDGEGRGRSIDGQVRLHDLYPTLLEAAGVPVPEGIHARTLAPLVAGAREPGRPAFAYVALTNYGMALLAPDGLKLEWRNSPWRALAGRFHWSRVEGFAERRLEPAPETAETRRWAEAAQDAYDALAPGLRLELAPGGAEPFEVEIVTELVDPVSVKIPRAGSAPLDWVDVGRLRGTVEAARPLRLHFERIPRRQLSVAVRAAWPGCETPATTEVQGTAESLRRPVERRLAPAGCADGRARAAAALVVRWQGPVPSSDWLPAGRELEEDLRALGYLN